MKWLKKLLWFGFKVSKNYGVEFYFFHSLRNLSDGISFFNLDIDLDLYKGDHSPKFKFHLVLFNWTIIEFNWYYLHHRDDGETISEAIKLKQDQIDLLQKIPETAMGYHIVDITLKNGNVLHNRVISSGMYLELKRNEKIDVNDIVGIK